MSTTKHYLQLAALLLSLSLLYISKANAETTPAPSPRLNLAELVFPHGVSVERSDSGAKISTRIKPTLSSGPKPMIRWEVSKQADFSELTLKGYAKTSAEQHYTIAVNMNELKRGQTHYFRFEHNGVYSEIGQLSPQPNNNNAT